MHVTERIEHDRCEPAESEGAAPEAAPHLRLDPGTRIGRYSIVEPIAAGGFGVVYRARAEHEGARDVAVKVLHADLSQDPSAVQRFEREIQVIRRVHHPCVVRILDVGTNLEGQPFFAMELIEGESLDAWIRRRGPCSAMEAVKVLEGICGALEQAHRQSVVHRDIKASNVMVREGEGAMRPVLLDFGVAKLLDSLGPGLTNSRVVLGTPSCMAPEQIEGKATDARTDVYALGALLYFMLTGEPAFYDPSPIVTMHLHLRARPPLASRLVPVCAAVDEVITRAMSKAPGERFEGADAFFRALRSAIQDEEAKAAKSRSASAIWLVVDVEAAGLEDDDLFSDLEDVLSEARVAAAEMKLGLAFESGNRGVFMAELEGSDAELEGRRLAACEGAERLRALLEARGGAHPGLHVDVGVYEGEALFEGDVIVDGEPLRMSVRDLARRPGTLISAAANPAGMAAPRALGLP